MNYESESASKQVRILVAEDFLAWRIRIRSLLQAVPGWKILYEATDGAEAVGKAAELLPDVVLLDIGLPSLNGIEVAKRIRLDSADFKIIFVTTHSDGYIRQAALEIADGYVLKENVESELVPTIAEALHDCPLASSV